MEHLHFIIVSANTVTLLAGGFVTVLADRAYRRTGSVALRALAIGFGCITAGTLLGGVLHQSGLASLLVGVTVQSLSIALGFALLGWSLFGPEDIEIRPEVSSP